MDYHVEMHRLLIYQAHILEHYNEENESHIKINFKRQCSQKKKKSFLDKPQGRIFRAMS